MKNQNIHTSFDLYILHMDINHTKINEQTQQPESPNKNKSFRFENGRRFHNDESSKYFLPNDEDEIDRLHSQHFLIKYVWQRNYLAPVDDLLENEKAKILDLG